MIKNGNVNDTINKTNYSAYIKRKPKRYWCYNCSKEFSKIKINSQNLECSFCHSTIIEELNTNDLNKNDIRPQDYIPYNTINQPNQEQLIFRVNRNNSFLGQIIEELIFLEYQNEEIEYILNYLMNYNQPQNSSHSVSKSAVDGLNKTIIDQQKLNDFGIENVCPICKEEFSVSQDCITLPCKHYFHNDCIMPWFNEHNSCPICRFELPTDDEDYEKLRKERNSQCTNSQ